MGTAKFNISKSVAGKDYFTLTAKNGEVILTSEEYESMQGLYGGIASVRKNVNHEGSFVPFVGKDGKYYFNLRAKNNKIIGASEAYNWKISRFFGIRSVRKNAVNAIVALRAK